MLRQAHLDGALQFHGNLADYRQFEIFCLCLREAKRTDWVVYSKRPFGGPEKVLAYLGRYTHKVAISNQRLVNFDGQKVAFRWKDYRTGQGDQLLELDGVEFIRRFLLHTLPDGFVRIRHYGFLANRLRKENLTRCRISLGQPVPAVSERTAPEPSECPEPSKPLACRRCNGHNWCIVESVRPQKACRADVNWTDSS